MTDSQDTAGGGAGGADGPQDEPDAAADAPGESAVHDVLARMTRGRLAGDELMAALREAMTAHAAARGPA